MAELRVRKRHRLRQKELRNIVSAIDSTLGTKSCDDTDIVDQAETPGYDILYMEGKILGMVVGGQPFLTVRGILRYGATRRFVTVDMGAVKFVANGADIMAPGIVDADPTIQTGNAVWIRDEKNLRPMAVGQALLDGPVMVESNEGKAVKTLHYVGDKIWALGEK